MSLPTIDIAVAVVGEKGMKLFAGNIPDPIAGIGYVVSWQKPSASVPKSLRNRTDVRIFTTLTTGLSVNRNNALNYCTADIIMPTDEDIIYRPTALRQLREIFGTDPSLDYVVFRYDGADSQAYPDNEITITGREPRGVAVTAFSLACRRSSLLKIHATFDTRFGIGAPRYVLGEDDLFFETLKRLGLKGRFIPLTVCTHPGKSTGFRQLSDPRLTLTHGVAIGLIYPLTAPLRVVLKATRLSRAGQAPFMTALWWLTRGWLESLTIRPPWKTR